MWFVPNLVASLKTSVAVQAHLESLQEASDSIASSLYGRKKTGRLGGLGLKTLDRERNAPGSMA
jgi:hypothetical protein